MIKKLRIWLFNLNTSSMNNKHHFQTGQLYIKQLGIVWKKHLPPVFNQEQDQTFQTIKTSYHYISHVSLVHLKWFKQSLKKNHTKSMLKVMIDRPPYIIVHIQTYNSQKKQSCFVKGGQTSMSQMTMVGLFCTKLVLMKNQNS